MARRTMSVAALAFVLGVVLIVLVAPATCQARTAKITAVSRATAKVGVRLIIKGAYFGSRQGRSTVTFGERPVSTPSPTGNKRWAPCAKKAKVLSWRRSSITVKVPSMAPGSHKVYVTVGGKASNSYPFSVAAATIVRGRTFSTASALGNVMGAESEGSNLAAYARNVLFEDCTFEATNQNLIADSAGVLTLGLAAKNYNLTFSGCTFKRNVGAGSGGSGWGGVNGVKAIYGVHDITFDGCTFEEFSRFSVEVWSNDDPANRPYNLAFYDCVFEPAGSQCISWSGGRHRLNSVVARCLFKGFGTSLDRSGGACMEIAFNSHIVTRGCQIWTGTGSPFNIHHARRPSYLYFKNVRVHCDTAHLYQSRSPGRYSTILNCNGMTYSRWVKCRFVTGDAAVCMDNLGYTGEAGSPTMWSLSNKYNDFSTSTVSGYISHRGVHIPKTAKGYWTSGNGGPHPTNRLPKRLPTQP